MQNGKSIKYVAEEIKERELSTRSVQIKDPIIQTGTFRFGVAHLGVAVFLI